MTIKFCFQLTIHDRLSPHQDPHFRWGSSLVNMPHFLLPCTLSNWPALSSPNQSLHLFISLDTPLSHRHISRSRNSELPLNVIVNWPRIVPRFFENHSVIQFVLRCSYWVTVLQSWSLFDLPPRLPYLLHHSKMAVWYFRARILLVTFMHPCSSFALSISPYLSSSLFLCRSPHLPCYLIHWWFALSVWTQAGRVKKREGRRERRKKELRAGKKSMVDGLEERREGRRRKGKERADLNWRVKRWNG